MFAASLNAPTPVQAGEALDALERALQEERQALLDNDADALLRSTQAKLAALRRAETLQPGHAEAERVMALSELNRANGILLSRRRREVSWALRHLGRVETAGVYDAGGQAGMRPQSRCLGVG
jgi:flagellar biosynthesis/type III secretory pathway chaperone